jgi:hypothetical protein
MRFFLKLILSLMLIAFGSVGSFFAAIKYRKQFDAMVAQIMVAGNAAPAERRIIYYRNPMGLPDTSPVPKKNDMNMDYTLVYEYEKVSDPSIVKVSGRVCKQHLLKCMSFRSPSKHRAPFNLTSGVNSRTPCGPKALSRKSMQGPRVSM